MTKTKPTLSICLDTVISNKDKETIENALLNRYEKGKSEGLKIAEDIIDEWYKGNEYYIIISAIGLSGREEDSDGNAPRMVRPTETKRVNLIISNDVILRWAMDNRKALLFK